MTSWTLQLQTEPKYDMSNRNYKQEYANYHGSAEQRARRSSRNKARRKATQLYGKAALKGKDVDHRDRNAMNNSRKNLRISSIAANRARNK